MEAVGIDLQKRVERALDKSNKEMKDMVASTSASEIIRRLGVPEASSLLQAVDMKLVSADEAAASKQAERNNQLAADVKASLEDFSASLALTVDKATEHVLVTTAGRVQQELVVDVHNEMTKHGQIILQEVKAVCQQAEGLHSDAESMKATASELFKASVTKVHAELLDDMTKQLADMSIEIHETMKILATKLAGDTIAEVKVQLGELATSATTAQAKAAEEARAHLQEAEAKLKEELVNADRRAESTQVMASEVIKASVTKVHAELLDDMTKHLADMSIEIHEAMKILANKLAGDTIAVVKHQLGELGTSATTVQATAAEEARARLQDLGAKLQEELARQVREQVEPVVQSLLKDRSALQVQVAELQSKIERLAAGPSEPLGAAEAAAWFSNYSDLTQQGGRLTDALHTIPLLSAARLGHLHLWKLELTVQGRSKLKLLDLRAALADLSCLGLYAVISEVDTGVFIGYVLAPRSLQGQVRGALRQTGRFSMALVNVDMPPHEFNLEPLQVLSKVAIEETVIIMLR
jgi:hypothetical protein